jgi:hypothetical protein
MQKLGRWGEGYGAAADSRVDAPGVLSRIPLDVLLFESVSYSGSQHWPDFERITIATIEEPACGIDGKLLSLEYVHYDRAAGPILDFAQ